MTTTFKLKKIDSNPSRTRFNVLRGGGDGDVVGSVSVHPSEEAALLASWQGGQPAAPASAASGRPSAKGRNAFVQALIQNKRPMSAQAILRGS